MLNFGELSRFKLFQRGWLRHVFPSLNALLLQNGRQHRSRNTDLRITPVLHSHANRRNSGADNKSPNKQAFWGPAFYGNSPQSLFDLITVNIHVRQINLSESMTL